MKRSSAKRVRARSSGPQLYYNIHSSTSRRVLIDKACPFVSFVFAFDIIDRIDLSPDPLVLQLSKTNVRSILYPTRSFKRKRATIRQLENPLVRASEEKDRPLRCWDLTPGSQLPRLTFGSTPDFTFTRENRNRNNRNRALTRTKLAEFWDTRYRQGHPPHHPCNPGSPLITFSTKGRSLPAVYLLG